MYTAKKVIVVSYNMGKELSIIWKAAGISQTLACIILIKDLSRDSGKLSILSGAYNSY